MAVEGERPHEKTPEEKSRDLDSLLSLLPKNHGLEKFSRQAFEELLQKEHEKWDLRSISEIRTAISDEALKILDHKELSQFFQKYLYEYLMQMQMYGVENHELSPQLRYFRLITNHNEPFLEDNDEEIESFFDMNPQKLALERLNQMTSRVLSPLTGFEINIPQKVNRDNKGGMFRPGLGKAFEEKAYRMELMAVLESLKPLYHTSGFMESYGEKLEPLKDWRRHFISLNGPDGIIGTLI